MGSGHALTEDQRQIQEMVRRLAREQIAPRADAIDRTAEYPQDMFELLRDAGLSTIRFAEEHAKCFASDTAMRVVTDAVHLFGASGISSDFPINRNFRDAKVLQIIEGTNQIQRNIIGDSLLGRLRR